MIDGGRARVAARARRSSGALSLALGGLLVLGSALRASSEARADAPHVVWISGAPSGEVAGRARRWQRRVARALAARGAEVSTEDARWAHEPGGSAEARVARLARVERLIREAHEARTSLRPREALARLYDAEAEARAALDVPGASAWYAEVQVALAVMAAEIGQLGLAEAALERAATIDPTRALRAAEAPPDLVARAEAIARRVATGPRGRFELRVLPPSIEAEVWLDGRRIGEAPARVEASVGAHVLRVSAPGHRTWARLVDVLEGARPPVEVALAPEPGLDAARALRAAADAGALDAVVGALGALARADRAPSAVWLVEASEGAIDRALVVACRASGCAAPVRVDAGRAESALPEDPSEPGEPLALASLARARDWLEEPIPIAPPPPPPTPWWEEPWPWIAAGVVVLGAAAVGIGVAWPAPVEQQRVVVDTSGVPR